MFGNYEKVLVVDDCEIVRRLLEKELRAYGFAIQTASDGIEALRLTESQDFDFVITDWDMPNLDGEVLCRCLRSARSPDRYIYIIMMTAHTKFDVISSFSAGVDDFVTKPLNISELLARMQAGVRVLERDRRMAHAAERDPLTGLFNRRSLSNRLRVALDECQRIGRPLSCILLDLDHFKGLNDDFGHSLGDTALIKVAELLKMLFRATDDVFRYGGEEFLVVLPNTDIESAKLCAERCREAIGELDLNSFGVDRELTASFGVAQMKTGEQSNVELLERADLALLAAKQAGRNCTVVHDTSDAESTEPVSPLLD